MVSGLERLSEVSSIHVTVGIPQLSFSSSTTVGSGSGAVLQTVIGSGSDAVGGVLSP